MAHMIERLRRALEHVEELSPEMQAELAEIIEEQTEPLDDDAPTTPEQGLWPGEENLPPRTRRALAAIGSARDLLDDDEFEALDRIRHAQSTHDRC